MEAVLNAGESRPAILSAEELCRRHAASVCRFAALVAPNANEADDLAQDALLRAVRAVSSYDSTRGSAEAWLWKIVVNAARDSARRRERMRWLIERIAISTPRESESVEAIALERLRDADWLLSCAGSRTATGLFWLCATDWDSRPMRLEPPWVSARIRPAKRFAVRLLVCERDWR